MKWFAAILDRIFSLCGALVFSQAPEFIQQYTQRLGGHVAELKQQVNTLSQIAALTGKNLDQYVHKFYASKDVDFVHQGELLRDLLERFQKLSMSLKELQFATPWSRPMKFLYTLDFNIAKETTDSFTLGIPLSLEGLAYGLCGLCFGWLFFTLFKKIFCFIVRPKSPKTLSPR